MRPLLIVALLALPATLFAQNRFNYNDRNPPDTSPGHDLETIVRRSDGCRWPMYI